MTAARLRRAAWAAALGCPAVAVASVVAGAGPAGIALSGGVVLLAVVATVVGVRTHLRSVGLQLCFVACGCGFAASEVLRATGLGGTVAPAVLALVGYGAATAFIVVMVRRVAHQAGAVLWLDAALVAVAALVVAWATLLAPAGRTGAVPADVAVEVAYLTVDALLLALVVQLSVRSVARVPAFWFLLLGFGCVLAGDLGRALAVAGSPVVDPLVVDAMHLSAFVYLAALSLHPSVAELRSRPSTTSEHARPARLTISYLALACATLVVLDRSSTPGWCDVLYLALVTGVFARMSWTTWRIASLQREARHRADHDELTGLLNRAATMSQLGARVRHGRPVRLLFVDLDHFKQINDTWGHATGDAVLREVAVRLRAAAGPDAIVGRVGGDEFVVAHLGDDDDLASRIQARFSAPFDLPDGVGELAATCSIGVATRDDGDVGGLVSDADMAMYEAKRAARSTVRHFTQDVRERLDEGARLRQLLDGALAREELDVWLQPLAEPSGAVTGYEALLRWDVPGRGMVPPATFVPIADEAGLMEPIGAWVLHRACADLVQIDPAGTGLHVTVNLTARQLSDPLLVPAVRRALDDAALAPDRLWLELTESSMVRDTVAARRNVEALRALGVVFALDDFGTGFASLAHLHDLDCQVVKIDQSFVARLDAPGSARAVVRAIVAMAHALDLLVVAEGVETPVQAEVLTSLGVDRLQGYYVGYPAPVGATGLAELLDLPPGATVAT